MGNWYWVGYGYGKDYFREAYWKMVPNSKVMSRDVRFQEAQSCAKAEKISSDDDVRAFLDGFEAGFMGY